CRLPQPPLTQLSKARADRKNDFAARRPAKPFAAVRARAKVIRAARSALAARCRDNAGTTHTRGPAAACRSHGHDRTPPRGFVRKSRATHLQFARAAARRFRLDRQTPRRALRGRISLARAV